MSITYKDWAKLTSKTFHRRSPQLQQIDKAFKEFELARGSSKDQALQKLATKFNDWKRLKGQDQYLNSMRNRKQNETGQGPVELLESLIRINSVGSRGNLRRKENDLSKMERLIVDDSLKGRFDKIKVQETYNRSARAIEKARDALIRARIANTPERILYTRWFGTYNEIRYNTVKSNIMRLHELFTLGVIIIHDARSQQDAWGDCYGFAMPGKKKNFVEFTVGRAFFEQVGFQVVPGATRQQRSRAAKDALIDAYKNTTDWTVGTMIHELGHAINELPDVDFKTPSSYQVSPGGLTPNGWEQCSTPDLDIALALADPTLAVRNTDSYGQFSREALG